MTTLQQSFKLRSDLKDDPPLEPLLASQRKKIRQVAPGQVPDRSQSREMPTSGRVDALHSAPFEIAATEPTGGSFPPWNENLISERRQTCSWTEPERRIKRTNQERPTTTAPMVMIAFAIFGMQSAMPG